MVDELIKKIEVVISLNPAAPTLLHPRACTSPQILCTFRFQNVDPTLTATPTKIGHYAPELNSLWMGD
jgi:hypothetical protein